jgi:hypothetical protein
VLVSRRRGNREGPVAERDRLTGSPGRWRLWGATTAGVLVLLGVLLLALPGNPESFNGGLSSAAQDAAFLIPFSAVVVASLLACVRKWSYRRLLYLPGPIHVVGIEEASAGPAPASPSLDGGSAPRQGIDGPAPEQRARLELHFRQRLSELQLSAPASTPGTKSSTDFVELLETSDLNPKQPFAVLGRVIRIIRPSHAYEVKTTLLQRDAAPSCGVAMEVVVLPQRRTTMRTYWRDGWDDALDRAATGVTAEVVPRSRHSDTGPWCSWKGFVLDEKLVDLHQQAQRLRGQRRYEEALDLFYAAVRRDPGNGYLRYALGTMQEELALYLDALLTYRSIPQVTWTRAAHMPGRAAERIELLARYRYTALLGFGEGLAEQWLPAPTEAVPSRRSEELRILRDRLRFDLWRLFTDCPIDPADLRRLRLPDVTEAAVQDLLDERPHLEWQREPETVALKREMTAREKDGNRRLRERRLHLFFQVLAAGEVRRLLDRYRGKDFSRLDTGLTAMSIELLPSWAALRTDRARHLLRAEVSRQRLRAQQKGVNSGSARKRRHAQRLGDWPPSPDEIQALWGKRPLIGRSMKTKLDKSREFVDHYHAACTYAIALLPADGGGEKIDKGTLEARKQKVAALAEAAVFELRRAADVGGSSALAARWDWILTEDPDLAELRGQPAFRQFEAEWLPSPNQILVRPSTIVRLNASRFSVRLWRRSLRHIERVWHTRAEQDGPTDIHEALEWWREEEVSWEMARELAHHHRHWQTRLKVIREMKRFADRNEAPPFRIEHRLYSTQPIEGDPSAVDRLARHETHFGDLRIGALAKALGPQNGPRLRGFDAWEQYLRALDAAGHPLSAQERKRLADNRAAAWGSLNQAFTERGTTETEPHKRFEKEFRECIDSLSDLRPPALSAASVSSLAASTGSTPHPWPSRQPR